MTLVEPRLERQKQATVAGRGFGLASIASGRRRVLTPALGESLPKRISDDKLPQMHALSSVIAPGSTPGRNRSLVLLLTEKVQHVQRNRFGTRLAQQRRDLATMICTVIYDVLHQMD